MSSEYDGGSNLSAQQIARRLQSVHRTKLYRRTQCLDANQLCLLFYTLNRPDLAEGVRDGTPLPPGGHLIYFTPRTATEALNADGTDTTFTADQPYQRRVWGGGEMVWERGNPLCIGDTALEVTELEDCEVKRDARGEDMLLMTVTRRLENGKGLALTDRRHILLRKTVTNISTGTEEVAQSSTTTGTGPATKEPPRSPESAGEQPMDKATLERSVVGNPRSTRTRSVSLDEVTVFRYSALTFNAHKIHYSTPWAQHIEQYPQLVVQAPLCLTLLLAFWTDCHNGSPKRDPGLETKTKSWSPPKKLTYRMLKPLFVGERCVLTVIDQSPTKASLRTQRDDGTVGMMAEIECFRHPENL